nr:MAG TPA: hypothetical protein [Caudoviricetes sp.]
MSVVDLEKVANWELQDQIQVLTHRLKLKNMQIRRLRVQAPFIKEAVVKAEKDGELRGILFAEQYNKIIDDVCEESYDKYNT